MVKHVKPISILPLKERKVVSVGVVAQVLVYYDFCLQNLAYQYADVHVIGEHVAGAQGYRIELGSEVWGQRVNETLKPDGIEFLWPQVVRYIPFTRIVSID